MIPFSAKPYKMGLTHVVTIPKAYIDNGLIDPAKEITFYFEPEQQEEKAEE